MTNREFYWSVKEAKKLDYRLETEDEGYRLTYEGASNFLKETYSSQFFDFQDDVDAWLEEVNLKYELYLRNLKLAKKVGPIEDGKLPAFTEGGLYPIYYYDKDCGMYCAECAQDDPMIETADVYWEGPAIECDGGCLKMLESAYGDTEEEEDELGNE